MTALYAQEMAIMNPNSTLTSHATPTRTSLPMVENNFQRRAPPDALDVFSHYVPRSGHPNWPELQRRAHSKAKRLLGTLDRPQPKTKTALRVAQSLLTGAKSFLENRSRAQVGREDLLPLYFIWTTHNTCNFLCSYCDDHRGMRYPELSTQGELDTQQGKRLLEVMRTRATSVYFAGGEPTLRKDLPELTRHARDLAYYPIIVNTNGSALGRQLDLPSWRTFLADIDIVVVSLDGLDLQWLGQTWGYDRPEEVIETLLLLRELSEPLRFKLAVNTVIQPHAIDQARDVFDLCCDLGIWFSPVPQNEGPAVQQGLHEDPAYRALSKLILERKAQGYRINGSARLNQRLLGSAPLVCRNTLKPHIDHNGQLFWPCKASVTEQPLRINVLDFNHVDDLWAHCTSKFDPRGFSTRCGGACNWAQNYSTDAYAHGLLHPLSILGEVRDFLRGS